MVWFAGQFSERKISSISDRLNNEEVLMRKALERPIFGWGRYGRSRVKNEEGKDIVRTDGMWIITLGQSGFVGLTAFAIILLLPGTIVLMRVPAALWAHPAVAPGIAVALLLTLYMIDNLFNAMPNPIFMLSCGIVGWYADQCAHQKTPIHSNGSREAAAIAV